MNDEDKDARLVLDPGVAGHVFVYGIWQELFEVHAQNSVLPAFGSVRAATQQSYGDVAVV